MVSKIVRKFYSLVRRLSLANGSSRILTDVHIETGFKYTKIIMSKSVKL